MRLANRKFSNKPNLPLLFCRLQNRGRSVAYWSIYGMPTCQVNSLQAGLVGKSPAAVTTPELRLSVGSIMAEEIIPILEFLVDTAAIVAREGLTVSETRR